MLRKHGIPEGEAYRLGNARKGYWCISKSRTLATALNNSYLRREGYLPLKELSTLPNTLF
jgi:hypothetical protein